MIVIDASVIKGAALKPGSPPEHALLWASSTEIIAVSSAVETEIIEVLSRPKFFASISPDRRTAILEGYSPDRRGLNLP